jgi:serpin B
MNRQLAAWLDSQTGGLLTDYTENIQLDPTTALALASTVYFSANWVDDFHEGSTTKELFHAKDQDIVTDFMHKTSLYHTYYEGEDFGAISLDLQGSHKMWLILPNEGIDPSTLLEQGDYYDLISHPGNWQRKSTLTVNLSLPKFDVSSEQNLISGLNAMGITDICNSATADYSPITSEPLYLDSAQHAARVSIDEEGVIAAAYTLMAACGSGIPEKQDEIDFILDRPFLFVITGEDDLPLFAGKVDQPLGQSESIKKRIQPRHIRRSSLRNLPGHR